MTRKLILAAALAGSALATVPGIALADNDSLKCTDQPQSAWMTTEAIKAKAEADGYQVKKVKAASSCFEVYGRKDGQRFELYYNPVDGKLVDKSAD